MGLLRHWGRVASASASRWTEGADGRFRASHRTGARPDQPVPQSRRLAYQGSGVVTSAARRHSARPSCTRPGIRRSQAQPTSDSRHSRFGGWFARAISGTKRCWVYTRRRGVITRFIRHPSPTRNVLGLAGIFPIGLANCRILHGCWFGRKKIRGFAFRRRRADPPKGSWPVLAGPSALPVTGTAGSSRFLPVVAQRGAHTGWMTCRRQA